MSRALAVGLVLFASSVQAGTMRTETPADPENWVRIETSQTPADAFPIYFHHPDRWVTFIADWPTAWLSRGNRLGTLLDFYWDQGSDVGRLYLPVRLTAGEIELDTVAINFAAQGNNRFVATLTSTLGTRQVETGMASLPEPSGFALALCGVLAVRRRH